MKSSNRVMVNTGVQYLRSFISIIITLYTTRVVLSNLGENDYGIYGLVGGVIMMLAFVQQKLSESTMRFLSYHDVDGVKKKNDILNTSFISHLFVALALCLVLLSLTTPLFDHFLNIAPERIGAAKVVYYCMLVSLFFNFLSSPFKAVLISHENIVYASIVEIVDAVLKIPIAVSLIWMSSGKLEWYSMCMMGVVLLNFALYYIYCRKKYPECKPIDIRLFNKELFKELMAFIGWGVYGSLCIIFRTQGIAVLLNKFFSTAVNAAYAIANQVLNQLIFLSAALTNAINPQIVKAEGCDDREKMFRLSETSCKFSFLLMSIVSVPVIIYMPTLLELWLKDDVPEYSVMFCRWVLIASQIDLMSANLAWSSIAIGNVKSYNLSQQTLKAMTIPVAYVALVLSKDMPDDMRALMVMLVFVGFETVCMITRVIFLHNTVELNIASFVRNVAVPVMYPLVINVGVCWLLSRYLHGWLVLTAFVASPVIVAFSTYYFSLGKEEKVVLRGALANLKNKFKRS